MSTHLGGAIATNTVWMVLGKTLSTALSLLLTAALARSLGVFGYGEFTTAFAFITFFSVIADFGFLAILVRELSQHPDREEDITGNLLALRATFGLIVYGLGGLLVWLLPYSSTIKWGVVILAAASFILSTNGTLIGVFQARYEMLKAVIGDVTSRAILLGLTFYALAAGWNLVAIFSLYLLANFLNLLITVGFIVPRLRLRLKWNFDQWRRFFREAWPLGIVMILSIIYFRTGTIILSVVKGSTEVGIYGAPYKIFELLTIVPTIFMGNVFPAVARLGGDPDRQAKFTQAALDVLLATGIGAGIGLAILARPIIDLVAGQEFVAASTISFGGTPITAVAVLALLAVALVAIFLAQLWSFLVIAHGRQTVLVAAGVWAVIVNVVLDVIFIPAGSYLAATIVTILTELLILIVWQRAARQVLPAMPSFGKLPKIIVAGLVMAGALLLLRDLPLIIPILAGGAVYLGLLSAWRVIPVEIWQLVRARVGRPA